MKCNACHREAGFSVKFTFSQRRPPGVPETAPRFAVSFETDGGYCLDCRLRMERMAKENNFTEIIGADARQEVLIIFQLRGWGEPAWNETVVEFFKLKEPDNNLSLALEKV